MGTFASKYLFSFSQWGLPYSNPVILTSTLIISLLFAITEILQNSQFCTVKYFLIFWIFLTNELSIRIQLKTKGVPLCIFTFLRHERNELILSWQCFLCIYFSVELLKKCTTIFIFCFRSKAGEKGFLSNKNYPKKIHFYLTTFILYVFYCWIVIC